MTQMGIQPQLTVRTNLGKEIQSDVEENFRRLKYFSNPCGAPLQHIIQTTDGQRMSYTLAAAAKATGLNKRTILQAIKGGKITATRDQLGKWHVESAELHRVYPAVEGRSRGSNAAQRSAAPDQAAALGTQIDAIIKRAEERLQQQLDGLRRDQHAEHD
jgi:hypothetical protein